MTEAAPEPNTPTKRRWLAKAEACAAKAQQLRVKAEKMEAPRGYEADRAFCTQPGRIASRDQMRDRLYKAYEIRKEADALDSKAAELKRIAFTNAGDAARKRQEERDAKTFMVGDLVKTEYGVNRVAKVNTKTLRLEGITETVDKAYARLIARPKKVA